MRTHLFLCSVLLAVPLAAAAQATPPALAGAVPFDTEFPADVSAANAATLRERFAGKVLRGQPKQGAGWRLDFRGNGWAFVDTTSGGRDTGRWETEDGRLCLTWQRGKGRDCSEVRIVGDRLLIKRSSNGEIVALE